jgi:hypothetical protein
LHYQFVLGLEDIDGRRPTGKAGFVSGALKDIVEHAIDLVLQTRYPAEGLETAQSSHWLSPPQMTAGTS